MPNQNAAYEALHLAANDAALTVAGMRPTLVPAPSQPVMVPPAPVADDSCSIAAVVYHHGAVCETCDSTGQLGGYDGRAPSCPYCTRVDGEPCTGQVCQGINGESCADGIYPARLDDGAFELRNGKCVCAACCAIATGYTGEDSPADLVVLNAIAAMERA